MKFLVERKRTLIYRMAIEAGCESEALRQGGMLLDSACQEGEDPDEIIEEEDEIVKD